MKLTRFLVCAAATLLLVPPVFADVTHFAFVNGGIGEEEQAMMHRIAKEFSLRIEVAEGKQGAFIAEVPISVTDENGKEVFSLTDAGPMLYVHLPKGKYVIKGVFKGVTQSGMATLDGKHGQTVILNWAGKAKNQ